MHTVLSGSRQKAFIQGQERVRASTPHLYSTQCWGSSQSIGQEKEIKGTQTRKKEVKLCVDDMYYV